MSGWIKISNCKWRHENGEIILKYKFAGRYEFLLYEKDADLEFGDYKTFERLREAKKTND